jgi:hypothetical protein
MSRRLGLGPDCIGRRKGGRSASSATADHRNSSASDTFSGLICWLGEIDMIKDLAPPTEAEEYRNVAEILRDLAAQARFGKTRDELFSYADQLDRLAVAQHQSEAIVQRMRHRRPGWFH